MRTGCQAGSAQMPMRWLWSPSREFKAPCTGAEGASPVAAESHGTEIPHLLLLHPGAGSEVGHLGHRLRAHRTPCAPPPDPFSSPVQLVTCGPLVAGQEVVQAPPPQPCWYHPGLLSWEGEVSAQVQKHRCWEWTGLGLCWGCVFSLSMLKQLSPRVWDGGSRE